MFNPSREQVSSFFCEAWRKRCAREVVTGAEAVAADLIEQHPEYHALLGQPESALEQEFTPETWRMNPFLHLSLHLAIAEQISIDQPPGIRAEYERLRQKLDVHDAEHAVLDCLGETLWYSQRHGTPLDGMRYLECLRQAAGR